MIESLDKICICVVLCYMYIYIKFCNKFRRSTNETKKILSYPRTDSQHITQLEWDGLKRYFEIPIVRELVGQFIALNNKEASD